MAEKPVTLSQRNGIAVIRLREAGGHGRLSPDAAWELGRTCERLNWDASARVVILTGCAGAFRFDLEGEEPSAGAPLPRSNKEACGGRAASAVAGLKAPSIAAINGDALDQGLELALACDLRVAAEGARLGFTGVSKGAMPWDGGSQRLPRIVGPARALDMLLTGRLLPAGEAHAIGLVNRVAAPDDLQQAVQRLAEEIAAGAPIASRFVKEAVYKGLDMSLDQGLNLEADLSFLLQTTGDRREGVRAFLENRKPRFVGE